MTPNPAPQNLDPRGQSLLHAATHGWQLNRVPALVLADYLDEAGDAHCEVVRALAHATLIQGEDARENAAPASGLTAAWSPLPRRQLQVVVRAATDCLPFQGEFEEAPRMHRVVFARVGRASLKHCRSHWLIGKYRPRSGCVYHLLRHYRLSPWWDGHYCEDFQSLLAAPKRYPLECLALLAFENLAACLLASACYVRLRHGTVLCQAE
jgi:hypothetical protein